VTRRWIVVAAGCLAAVLAAGCSTEVNGRGVLAVGPSGSRQPDFPSAPPSGSSGSNSAGPSGGATPARGCPKAVDPKAGLSYACISPDLQPESSATWTLELSKEVDINWFLGEGSGVLPPDQNGTLRDVSEAISASLAKTDYGDNPTSTQDSSTDTTIGGKPAHVVQTTITLNPTYVKNSKLKVTKERLWIAVIDNGTGLDAVWYVTIPDIVSNLWAAVPGVIKSITVS
jgi:hypothetical protein